MYEVQLAPYPPPYAVMPNAVELEPFVPAVNTLADVVIDPDPPAPTKIVCDDPGVTETFAFSSTPPPPPPPPTHEPPPPPPPTSNARTDVTPDGTVQ